MKKITALLFLLFTVATFYSNGQESTDFSFEQSKEPADTVAEKKVYKNTISFNISNPTLISSRFIYLTYERLVKENQSFSFSVGTFSIPKFNEALGDSLNLDKEYKDKGLHLGGDYRFYLKKLNKYNAPRGVYIGPYYTYNYLKRENTWHLQANDFNGEVNSELKISIHNIGAQLGYQFVFWERLSVDCILLGPGLGFYSLKTKLGTTLSAEEESLFFERLNEALEERFPGYDYVIDSGEYKKTGSVDVQGAGFRYLINVGFRF